MMKWIRAGCAWTGLVLTGVLTAAPAAMGQEVADFYQGSTLTILIGHPPGGSYDLYAQVAASHLGKHIPGNPTVIVEHRPGGGGSVAAAHFANAAPRDGSMIALLPETLAHTQLLDPERSRWDIREMTYIGSFAPANPVLMVNDAAEAQSLEDLHEMEAAVACTGRTSQSDQLSAFLKYFTGMKLNIVCGYDGSANATLAVLNGEADMTAKPWASWLISGYDEYKEGKIKPLVQLGLRRNADLPEVPLLQEVLDDPADKQAIEFISAAAEIGRALLAPPEVPEERVEALRTAFDAMVEDEEFLADAESRTAIIQATSGEATQDYADQIFAAPPDIIARSVDAMKGFD